MVEKIDNILRIVSRLEVQTKPKIFTVTYLGSCFGSDSVQYVQRKMYELMLSIKRDFKSLPDTGYPIIYNSNMKPVNLLYKSEFEKAFDDLRKSIKEQKNDVVLYKALAKAASYFTTDENAEVDFKSDLGKSIFADFLNNIEHLSISTDPQFCQFSDYQLVKINNFLQLIKDHRSEQLLR